MSTVLAQFTAAFEDVLSAMYVKFANSRIENTGGNCYAAVAVAGEYEVIVTNGDDGLTLDACTATWSVSVRDSDGDSVMHDDVSEGWSSYVDALRWADAVVVSQQALDAEGKSLDLADCGRADR